MLPGEARLHRSALSPFSELKTPPSLRRRRRVPSVNLMKVENLHPVEVRVLGALVEKDMATPEYYPLTPNALQNACNQKSSREPVVQYDEETVSQALELLKNKGLAIRVSGAGHRVEKFGHRLGEKLNLGRRELALLCVLMLRGPQTVGELRGRTERMHDFTDLEEVETVLDHLAGLPEPLVMKVPRGRWAHLLSGEPGSFGTRWRCRRRAPDQPRRTRRHALTRTERSETKVRSLRAPVQIMVAKSAVGQVANLRRIGRGSGKRGLTTLSPPCKPLLQGSATLSGQSGLSPFFGASTNPPSHLVISLSSGHMSASIRTEASWRIL